MTVVQTQASAAAPTEWVSKRLFDLSQFIPGKAHEPFIDPLGEYICVNSKFISTEGQVAKMCNRNITPARKNDILLVMSDLPNGRALGKCFLVDEDDRYAVNQRVCILRPRAGNDPQMLFHLLNRNPYFLSFNDGVNQTHLLNSVFEKCELVVPADPTEQERVGEALSDADALIEGLERLIAKKRRIKQGAMQDLLTAKRRLPGFSGEWKTVSLNDLLLRAIGGGTPSRTVKDYWEGDIPWMTVKDFTFGSRHSTLESITEQGLKNSASASIPAGTLILCTRMAVGKTAIMSVDVAINQDLKALFFGDDCIPRFYQLLFELRQREIEESAGGSTVKGVSLKDIRAIEMPKPRKDEQMKLAQVFDDMDAEIQTLETRLEKAWQVKEGMMQNLLTGRIRLV